MNVMRDVRANLRIPSCRPLRHPHFKRARCEDEIMIEVTSYLGEADSY